MKYKLVKHFIKKQRDLMTFKENKFIYQIKNRSKTKTYICIAFH